MTTTPVAPRRVGFRRGVLSRLALAGALALPCMAAQAAQDEPAYPSRPVNIVVPYGGGSIADLVPRLLGNQLQSDLGLPFIIEFKPGAGGLIGADYVLRQPADGYSILSAATNNLVINQFLFSKQKLDPLATFVPVAKVVSVPLLVVVNAKLPIRSVDELVAYLNVQKGNANYASPSAGTLPHLAAALFLQASGTKAVHVPYRGGSAMATALGAGEVQFALVGYSTVQSMLQSGRVRALAVIAPQRLAMLPTVPTVQEAGWGKLAEAIPDNWWMLVARKETPPERVQALSAAIESALKKPALIKLYEDAGLQVSAQTGPQLQKELQDEAQAWQKRLKGLDLKM
ncbi:Bug family tripartite tricarboxylate transporter substrate binding protein [Alcaligenes sp. SDU_A2]|uniref:Bug family tripartite tricarboxylate transporter substrate binding protein n=1 Tax=Alcaligenes sp. SDU_A2 TaxID=3136634 RepID=UPI00311F96E7